jgi:hypothetical protein
MLHRCLQGGTPSRTRPPAPQRESQEEEQQEMERRQDRTPQSAFST